MKRIIATLTLALAMVGMAAGQGNVLLQNTADVSNVVGAGKQTVVQFFNQVGSANIALEFKFSGTPATTSIPILGCMRGGTCNTLTTIATGTNTIFFVGTVYDYLQMTPVFTGGTNPFVTINYTSISQSSGGGTGAGSTTIQGPDATGTATASITGNPILLGAWNGSQLNRLVCAGSAAQCGFWANGTVGDAFTLTSTVGLPYNPGNGSAAGGGVKSLVAYQNGPALGDLGFWCGKTVKLNAVSATTTQLLALAASQKIRVCSLILENNSATAVTVKLVEGTGANCGAGTADLTGLFALTANTSPGNFRQFNFGATGALITNTAADALCVTVAGAGSVEVTATVEQH